MQLTFDTNSVESYRQFLQLRNSPVYHFRGNTAIVPDEYASRFGLELEVKQTEYRAIKQAFDYQRDITRTAIQKRKYAIFADCGLGKTLMLLEYARHALKQCGGRVLIVCPLMVCRQTIEEAGRFYKSMNISRVVAADLQGWLDGKGAAIGVTNYEAIREGLTQGNLTALILDESSMLKSHYGA
jgi:superfamily II DNA or RNA helicase